MKIKYNTGNSRKQCGKNVIQTQINHQRKNTVTKQSIYSADKKKPDKSVFPKSSNNAYNKFHLKINPFFFDYERSVLHLCIYCADILAKYTNEKQLNR